MQGEMAVYRSCVTSWDSGEVSSFPKSKMGENISSVVWALIYNIPSFLYFEALL